MTALTFTADLTTDQLTIAAHGLLTGDGPAAVRNIGGTLPAATPALGPVLDRWVIRVDANTIKLATSSTLAHAGTAIDITSNGTGTNVLEIGVPYRRARTYANGSILYPDDLNAMFDAHVALYDLLTGQAQSVYTGVTLAGALTTSGLITASAGVTAGANQNVTVSGTGEFKHAGETITFGGFVVQSGTVTITTIGDIVSASSCVLIATIPLKQGDRITSITVTFDSVTGTVDVTDFHVDKVTANGTATLLGSTSVSNIGTVTTTSLSLTPTTLAANERFIVSISINATGCTVRNPNATFTHP